MAKTSYERVGAAAVLTITRPERRNAVDDETAAELLDGFHRFEADDEARALVLTGEGPEAFCAGADLKAFAERAETFLAEHPDGGSADDRNGSRRNGSTSGPTGRSASRGCGRRSRRSRRSRAGRSPAGSSSRCGATCASRPPTREARLHRAALRSAADRRRHPAPAADRRRRPRAGDDPHRPHRRGRRGARLGPRHRGRRAGAPPRARARDRRGAGGLPAGDDALRPPGGARGDRAPFEDGLALEADLGRASTTTGAAGATRFAAGEGRGAAGAGV